MEKKQINTKQEYLESLSLPDEVSHFIWLVYGQKNYNNFDEPKSHRLSGTMMLYDIERMLPEDYRDYKAKFNSLPKVTNETAGWLIDRGYDVFGFIKKGWIANQSIYDKEGYYTALKQKDRNLLAYQRELKKEEDKLGIKEENKGSLLERRSWTTLTQEKIEPLPLSITYNTPYGFCQYEHNEIGKITRRAEISHDGELLYEGLFYYRYFKNNYYLYKYTNTNGIHVNFDTLSNERRGFKGNFR